MRERFGWDVAQEFIRLFRFARPATALKRHQIAEGADSRGIHARTVLRLVA
jgi:hypothetical protein